MIQKKSKGTVVDEVLHNAYGRELVCFHELSDADPDAASLYKILGGYRT